MQAALLISQTFSPRPLAGIGLGCLIAFSGASFAARDAGQMLAQDKANKEVIARRTVAAASDVGSTARVVLPLDHGPRATTTPWLNEQRRLQAAAANSAKQPSSVVSGATAPPLN